MLVTESDQTSCGGALVLGVSTHASGGLELRVPDDSLENFVYLLKVFAEFYIDQAIRTGAPRMPDELHDALNANGWGMLGYRLAPPIDDGRRAHVVAIRMRSGSTAWGIVHYPTGHTLRARIVPPGPDTMTARDVAELLDLWAGQWVGFRRGRHLELVGRDDVIRRFWTSPGARDPLATRLELKV